MKKKYAKLMIVVMALTLACIVAGCGGNKEQDRLAGGEGELKETVETDTSADESESIEATEAASDIDLDAPISYTYENHPYSFVTGEKELAMSNMYSIELDSKGKEMFPKLQTKLDEIAEDDKKEILDFFTGSEDDIAEMIASGWFLPYELDHGYTPIRSDGRVFSFSLLEYTYLAGAHGVASFKGCNLDPVTGESISFSDVVKETKDMPDIIADELQKQNEDLVDYFESCPGDLQNLKDGIPERLSENAKNLAWALDYDGIVIYFEDYAMGSYAIGSQSVKLRFKDYPDVFTETYNNYEDLQIPDIENYAKELKEADKTKVEASADFDNSSDEYASKVDELLTTKPVTLSNAETLSEMADCATFGRVLNSGGVVFSKMDNMDKASLRHQIMNSVLLLNGNIHEDLAVRVNDETAVPLEDAEKLFKDFYDEEDFTAYEYEKIEHGFYYPVMADGEGWVRITETKYYEDDEYILLTGPSYYESNGGDEDYMGYADILFSKNPDSRYGVTLLYGRYRDEG